MIPSHMFQVRVQCVACHLAPKELAEGAHLTGRTFRPSEEACVGCHGERYRGMLRRWVETLGAMSTVVKTKLEGVQDALRGADPTRAQHRRARQLAADAEHNLQFVILAKGVHNVFYAADLLKLASGWLDEATALLGRKAEAPGDALVRGGYCAVLCHEQAGVKLPATVVFGRQRLPHGRHVTEFGAACTACHSAEVHTAVTATPATCMGCHHSPRNDRCESCHRAQSALYRGQVPGHLGKVEANVMAQAVPCTGCHDLQRRHSRRAVAETCVSCHDAAYRAFVDAWTTGLDTALARAAQAVRRAEAALAREHRRGRRPTELAALLRGAQDTLRLVRQARGAHNPEGAEALLEGVRQRADAVLGRLNGR